jgi:TorA maturation chaperone TorD
MTPLAPELFRALGALCEAPDPAHSSLAAALGLPGQPDVASHTELFAFQLVPYASVYLGADGMLGGDAGDRVAGFWRALRLDLPREPDHLATLLGLYAAIGEHERDETDRPRALMWRQARRALLWEHLLTWVPPYAVATAAISPPFYAGWAALLADALRAEAQALSPPPASPLHLRDVPGLPSAEQGLETLIRGLISPVRSGLIVTRNDLARAAETIGLGLRLGERSFVLRSMFEQQPAATFAWLVGEADRWAAWHRAAEPTLGTVAGHWRRRAVATRHALIDGKRKMMELAHVP